MVADVSFPAIYSEAAVPESTAAPLVFIAAMYVAKAAVGAACSACATCESEIETAGAARSTCAD